MVTRTIVAAAIRTDDGRVWSLPQPQRHHDVIRVIRASGYEGPVGGERQGFVTSDGLFATRKAAAAIVRRAGQPIRGVIQGTLTSENLW